MKDQTYMRNYAKLKAFFDEHGHSDVKAKGSGGLGHFVSTTRTLYRRQSEVGRRLLSEECIADLQKVNFIFVKNKCRKSEQFKKLVKGIRAFRKHYKHVNIDSTSENAMPNGCEELKHLLCWARSTRLGRDRIEDLYVMLNFSLEPTSTDQSCLLENADTFASSTTSRTSATTIAASSSLHSFTLTPPSATSMVGTKPSDMDALMMPSDDLFPNSPGEDEIAENSLLITNAEHEKSRVEESSQNTFDNRNFSPQERSNQKGTGKSTKKNKRNKRKPLVDVNVRAEGKEAPHRRAGLRSTSRSSKK